MALRAVLVTGATGKQGGSVVDALLKAHAPYEILAVTRDAQSSSSKKLKQKSSRIKLVTGNLDAADEVFKAARESTKLPIWGVFSVQALGKNEEKQGKDLIDASIKNSVSHFVFSSADRGGANSDSDPTTVPHFITKHNIEQHLFSESEKSSMTYTVLRPVAFYENLTADFFGKVFTTSWAIKLPKEKPLQFISTSDIGFFAAQAFLESDTPVYQNKRMSLAGDSLSFEQFRETFGKSTGEKLPMTYRSVAGALCWMSKELGYMFNWFREKGFGADNEECKRMNPEMKGFETWLETESSWRKG
ncbi:hypothetical protein J4E91_009015 [Alternaria rosae]|nr:hypothetical protein J4E91_009015 [Alternaria rosae]